MSDLISVRTNIFYDKVLNENKEEEFKKNYELVLLVDKPKYFINNQREIIKEQGVEDLRIALSEKNLDALIGILERLKKLKE
jgi:hypothetical protein